MVEFRDSSTDLIGMKRSPVRGTQCVVCWEALEVRRLMSAVGDPAPGAPQTPGLPPTPTQMPVDGWVTGTVFNDKNGNGVHDRGEGVLPGWRVYVDSNGDGKWEKGEPFALTNPRGVYKLKLAPGSYPVREVPKGNWTPGTPASGAFTLTLGSGQTLSGQDFANVFQLRTGRR